MPAAARVGDTHEGVCSHGLSCCPHNVKGTIIGGSPNVKVNGSAAARLLDPVAHNCPHCGTGYISSASGTVFINGLGAAREGDAVTYPGGKGVITSGSGNVYKGG